MEHKKLNQFFATAISGNDILSSALYVSGIAILFAGIYAPLVLLFVALVLFLYKAIYIEVVEALPLNGGVYNCLLNGTSKTVAALAGITTFLSYIATAVISAKVAVEYVHSLLPTPILLTTIFLLFIFALLVISGISQSAKVALGIFIFHIITLSSFLIFGLLFFLKGHSSFATNFTQTALSIPSKGGISTMLFFAVSASFLGISGFESSADFVEEQRKGVFRKTLRNMLIGIAIFNPLIALVVLNTLPLEAITHVKGFLLADVARVIGGTFFQKIIVVDAFVVLSGAVLTSYVGVSGLISRMAADNCLPHFFTQQNKKGSYPRIVLGFFLLCSSILLLTKGNLLSLAGVYTIAFLGVMTLFGIGNLILRINRPQLKRTYRAPILFVILASLATLIGIIGNIRIDPQNLIFFTAYFIPSAFIVLVVVYQDLLLRLLLRKTKNSLPKFHDYLQKNFRNLTEETLVVFVRHVGRLHEILEYLNKNERGWKIYLICCRDNHGNQHCLKIKEAIPHLQAAGVFPHFNLTLVYKDKLFSPTMIDEVAKEFHVRKNQIFIGSIHNFHAFDYADLGGARVIF